MAQTRILMVLTSNDKYGVNGGETGLWLEEFAAPFYAFEDAGISAEIATIRGGAPAIDPKSIEESRLTESSRRCLEDTRLREGLNQAPAMREVQSSVYDAIYLPGGHGALWDFAASPELVVALEQFSLKNLPIAATGHGVAALTPILDRRGQPLTRGRKIACFSDEEENEIGVAALLPFLLESKMRQLGAELSPTPPFTSNVCVDDALITGQNGASAAATAAALIQLLRDARAAA